MPETISYEDALYVMREEIPESICICTLEQIVELIATQIDVRIDGSSTFDGVSEVNRMFTDHTHVTFVSATSRSRTARRSSCEKVLEHMTTFGINRCVIGNVTFVHTEF